MRQRGPTGKVNVDAPGAAHHETREIIRCCPCSSREFGCLLCLVHEPHEALSAFFVSLLTFIAALVNDVCPVLSFLSLSASAFSLSPPVYSCLSSSPRCFCPAGRLFHCRHVARTRRHARAHSHPHIKITHKARARAHTHTHIHTHTHTRTLSLSLSHTHTHTRTHIRARNTHTHIHTH